MSLAGLSSLRHTGGDPKCGGYCGEDAHDELNHDLPRLFVLHGLHLFNG